MGDIVRAKRADSRYVEINKQFTHILKKEYMSARRIFCEKKNVNALPVVDEKMVLLGAYSRWDDLKLSLRIMQGGMRRFAGERTHVILVHPCDIFCLKKKAFEYAKEYLELQGIKADGIAHSEIAEYIGETNDILFVDEDEMRAMRTLCKTIWNMDFGETRFYTYKQVFGEVGFGITYEEMSEYLCDINTKGVYVLNLLFERNNCNDSYHKALMKEFQKKYDSIGKSNVNKVYPEMYEDFFDNLYTEKYADSITHIKYQIETVSGLKMLKDCQSEFYNVKEGERYTYGQPEDFERTIYFVGACYMYGYHTEDKHTIESYLQDRINKSGYKVKVVNCGSLYNSENYKYAWMRIKSLPLKEGDIVVYGDCRFEGIAHLNLLDVCKKHEISSKWMTNDVRHCNHRVNALYADAIYDALKHIILKNKIQSDKMLGNKEDLIETIYVNRCFKSSTATGYNKIGSIVMNCNPFTYGHRYLIEQALRKADSLIIFVVEEDESLFSFEERLSMVSEGTSDLNNVIVVPSGPFILSKATFPEYFIKEEDGELIENVENDIRIFAKKIAPRLNIKFRFVGDEPEDKVTNKYNLAMKKILPLNGIELVEIPRKKQNGKYISASSVRRNLEKGDFDELRQLVPESTYRIMFERNY